jgi:acyl-CoA thioesterase
VSAVEQAWSFDAYTAVDPADGAASALHAPGGFLGVGGGFAAAVALRAMTGAVAAADRVPRSLSLHLLAPIRTEPAVVVTPRVERTGRSTTAASARIEQEGTAVALAHGTFGVPGGTTPPPRRDVRMPAVPTPDACAPLEQDVTGRGGAMTAHVERRPVDGTWPLSGAAEARLLVWMRVGEERPLDPLSVALLADAAVPPLYATLTEPAAIPSLDIAVHFAPLPPPEPGAWVLGDFRHVDSADGFVVDDGELWTPGGSLLAVVRQLRRVL